MLSSPKKNKIWNVKNADEGHALNKVREKAYYCQTNAYA